MSKEESLINSVSLSDVVVQGMLEKKAKQVVVLDLRDVKNAVADFFVICSGTSDTQIDAIAESIEEQVYKTTDQIPWRTEGKQNKEWVLMDYIDVVAHVFKTEKREHFGLEELWGDAQIKAIQETYEG